MSTLIKNGQNLVQEVKYIAQFFLQKLYYYALIFMFINISKSV